MGRLDMVSKRQCYIPWISCFLSQMLQSPPRISTTKYKYQTIPNIHQFINSSPKNTKANWALYITPSSVLITSDTLSQKNKKDRVICQLQQKGDNLNPWKNRTCFLRDLQCICHKLRWNYKSNIAKYGSCDTFKARYSTCSAWQVSVLFLALLFKCAINW